MPHTHELDESKAMTTMNRWSSLQAPRPVAIAPVQGLPSQFNCNDNLVIEFQEPTLPQKQAQALRAHYASIGPSLKTDEVPHLRVPASDSDHQAIENLKDTLQAALRLFKIKEVKKQWRVLFQKSNGSVELRPETTRADLLEAYRPRIQDPAEVEWKSKEFANALAHLHREACWDGDYWTPLRQTNWVKMVDYAGKTYGVNTFHHVLQQCYMNTDLQPEAFVALSRGEPYCLWRDSVEYRQGMD